MPTVPAFFSNGREATGVLSGDRRGFPALFITFLLAWTLVGIPVLGQTAGRDSTAVADTAQAGGLDHEVRYSAVDSIRYDLQAMRVYLYGKATVKYDDITLEADRIIYDFQQETVQAFPDTMPSGPRDTAAIAGLPRFTQGTNTVRADSLRYNFRTQRGYIREARTKEEEAYVGSKRSKLHANKEVHSRGGMLTTCDREKPHYGFRVSKMIVIPEDKIIVGPAYMRIGPVPTPIAIPFALVPNKPRGTTGILLPSYGYSDAFGYFFLNGGVYTPLGAKADLQLTGDIYTRGSWGARGVLRYKQRYRYGGTLDLTHNTKLNGDPEFTTFSRDRTYFLRWTHTVDSRASLRNRFNAQLNLGSSNSFTNNLNSSQTDYLSNTFQSNLGWTRLWPGRPFTASVNATHNQNTLTREFNITLPSINFNLQRVFPGTLLRPADAVGEERWYERIGVTYAMNFDNQLRTTEDQLSFSNMNRLVGDFRNGIRHTAGASTSFKTKYFTVNPALNAVDRMYFETQRRTYVADLDSVFIDTVPGFANAFEWNARTDVTSKIYGQYNFRGGKVKAIRHVITPTVGLSYRPDQSTAVVGPFGESGAQGIYNPFSIGIYGAPADGASGLVSMSLQQNLEAKVQRSARDTVPAADGSNDATKKIKLLDFLGIGTGYDLMKDSINWSPFSTQLRTSFFNLINVNASAVFDPYAVDTNGTRFDKSHKELYGSLARLTSASAAVGFELKSKRYGGGGSPSIVGESDPSKGARIDFSMPWRLAVNYTYDIGRAWKQDTYTETDRQSVLFNGDITVFKYWKLGAQSGYDITAGEWTPTSLNLYWDLHCWEFNFNVVPIGVRQSFGFRINVKASILKDIKYDRTWPIRNDGELLY